MEGRIAKAESSSQSATPTSSSRTIASWPLDAGSLNRDVAHSWRKAAAGQEILMWRGILVLLVVSGGRYGGDPGRNATPTSNFASTLTQSTEVIPLDQVSKSQAATVWQRIANTDITITYSRPVARGRALFGALVPYGEVWNPGADQATAIAVTRGVAINGQALQAGKYSIWAIPRQETWTIIFSRAADVYHTPYPGESEDALRVEARPEQGAHIETLCFYFPIVEGKDAVLRLHWGTVMVPLAIRVP
jgi:hypothetical protein